MDTTQLEAANALSKEIAAFKEHEKRVLEIIDSRGNAAFPFSSTSLYFGRGDRHDRWESRLRPEFMVMTLPDQITLYLSKLRAHILELEKQFSQL